MRVFIAIPLPAIWSDALPRLDALNLQGEKIRRVRPQDLHITQLFLGQVQDEEALMRGWNSLAGRLPSFRLRPAGFCLKPSHSRAMLWLRFHPQETFTNNAHRLGDSLIPYIASSRPPGLLPVPHITLVRAQHLRAVGPLPSWMEELRVTHYELWRSHLTPRGASYSHLGRIPLSV